MIRFVLRRLWRMVPALLGVALVTFALVHLAPGDPVQAEMSGEASRGELSDEGWRAPPRLFSRPAHVPQHRDQRPAAPDAGAGPRLGDADRRAENVRAIARIGGAGLSFLVPRLEKLAPPPRRRPEGLGRRERMGIAEDLARGGPPLERLARLLE